ncbi:hypothetical protein G4B88_003679 [Cannabis sativa]|uniref:Ubiquitin-like domain-containing protein n=1 Tax=Cannabis sativa TaxID=3483 RepID=A0A7J6DJF4_CANSA|nr:hypothetical protein G4B88_003679 [Cannabis sativa]
MELVSREYGERFQSIDPTARQIRENFDTIPFRFNIGNLENYILALASIVDLKKNIEAVQGADVYPASQHMLIHQGKVLENTTTLEENAVAESSFIVIMLTKERLIYRNNRVLFLIGIIGNCSYCLTHAKKTMQTKAAARGASSASGGVLDCNLVLRI